MHTILFAFRTSDLFGKLIVAILILLSVYAWTLMSSKRAFLSVAKRRNRAFLTRFRTSVHPAQLKVKATNGFVSNVPFADIYVTTMTELLNYLHRHGVSDQAVAEWQAGVTGPALPESELASVRAAAEGALNRELLAVESHMTFLATCTNAAPSLGLLGTVWGIMRAFMDMVGGGSAIVITAVAPGIASALLTTVAGLLVSIPSAVGYNFLNDRLNAQKVDLENFTDELLANIVRIHGSSSAPSGGAPAAPQVVIQSAPAPVAYAPAYVPAPAPAPAPAAAYAPPPAVPAAPPPPPPAAAPYAPAYVPAPSVPPAPESRL